MGEKNNVKYLIPVILVRISFVWWAAAAVHFTDIALKILDKGCEETKSTMAEIKMKLFILRSLICTQQKF